MRCMNCGWENPSDKQNCERCNSPLTGMDSNGGEFTGNAQPETPNSNLRSTIREAIDGHSNRGESFNSQQVNQQYADNDKHVCEKCGYILSPSMNVCPQCGTVRNKQHINYENNRLNNERHCPKCGNSLIAGTRFCPNCGSQVRNSGTVNAWDNPSYGDFCSLRPIPWSRENITYNAISFSGNRIILNRANTDPNNQSITSHEQAVLTHDGKDWYIEDLSEQHSTMIRVSRKTKLHAGDVIALGNRLFEFQD